MRKVVVAGMVMPMLCVLLGPASALTVRVRETAGGPQIVADGKAIAPRFFWGSPGSGSVEAGPEWASYSFDFTPARDVVDRGTLHFRFGKTPGTVQITDVRIVNTVTGADALAVGSFADQASFEKYWQSWPLGEANTVGTMAADDGVLTVTLANPKTGAWPDFHVYCRTISLTGKQAYRVSFRARSDKPRMMSPAMYDTTGGIWSHLGGPPGLFHRQVALARDAGVNLVSFSAPNCWYPPEQEQDWGPVDAVCRGVLAVNPKALLVPRVSGEPPSWYLQRHPEAQMVYDDHVGNRASVSNREARKAVCEQLEKLCRHLCEAFPDNFAGIHPCGQNTGEWFYADSWMRPLSGYDPATIAAFRDWLRQRGIAGADTAQPPTAEERRAHPLGYLRDPAKERLLVEFARFQQQEMADHVCAMAAACRKGTGGEKLVVFFYGYYFEFPPLSNGAPTSGHYAMEKVMSSKDIDILCSPISYTDRQWAQSGPCMSAAESVKRAGILWLNEDDTRTYLDPRQQDAAQEGIRVDLKQTQQLMLRNTAQAALRGFGTWWMDLPGQGWFNDPEIWKEQVLLKPVEEAMLARTKPFTPDIAAIVGEDSMCHLTGGSAVAARPLVYEGRAAIGRCGAPYGQYALVDATAGKIPARLQLFLAAWSLTPQQRSDLQRNRAQGTTRVWCWAPGYLFPDRADVAAMTQMTGFRHRLVDLPTAEVTATAEGQKLGLAAKWGPTVPIQPLFAVEDARPEEVLATYSDGSAAVAMRRSAAGLDVFVGVPMLTPELVRALAKLSGVHLYAETDVALWAAEGHLSLHAVTEGPLTLDVGKAGPVFDALDGKQVGVGPRFVLPVSKGDSRVLRF